LDLDSNDAGILLLLADIARRRGDNKDRLRWIDRTVELYREHPGALLSRGWAYLDLGRVSDAVVDAKLVSDAYPRLASAQALLSRAFLLIGRASEAVDVAERAVGLNGGDVDAQLALGLSRSAEGKNNEAEKCFLKALEIDPFSAEARADYAWFLRGQKRLDEAKKQWMEASHLEPSVFPALGLSKIKR
jgi:tetratricopeptide (TPR) repeat protein